MKIHIKRTIESLMVEFYLYRRYENTFETFKIKESGEIISELKEVKYGEVMNAKPTFILPEFEARELLKAFAELAESEGIEKQSETFSKGKLESQSEHLKDLRKLLKL